MSLDIDDFTNKNPKEKIKFVPVFIFFILISLDHVYLKIHVNGRMISKNLFY